MFMEHTKRRLQVLASNGPQPSRVQRSLGENHAIFQACIEPTRGRSELEKRGNRDIDT